jgi:acetylornithine deacetylase/succinyl-diaminopimelate desuccinylase-like protein
MRNLLLCLACSCLVARGQDPPPVAKLLVDLIKINTTNPAGNEAKVATFLAPIFKEAGFEITILDTPQAGKTHFIARLKGDGSKRPLLIAAHSDVVGVEREKWSVDPFGGVIKDGHVYGRGAIDFKGGLAVFAQAALDVAAQVKAGKIQLTRDLIFLSEADEEAGFYNTTWIAENAWDKIDCEFALNEGGWILKDAKTDQVKYVSISTADKSAVSFILRATGDSTHSSLPAKDNAIFQLARAMARLSGYDTRPKLNASTKQFFLTLSETSEEPMKTHFKNLVLSNDPDLIKAADQAISDDVLLHAIMRNTIAPVFFNAGFRGNVIPGSAEATINMRVVPGTTAGELLDELKTVINDPKIEVIETVPIRTTATQTPEEMERMKKRNRTTRSIPESPQETVLYKALVKHAQQTYPGALVTPYLFQAGTDAAPWRLRGIPVYGIYPYPITNSDLRRMHGNDERVPIASLQTGLRMITSTLVEITTAK